MVFASSVSPARRANLRRLRAEFEAAFDAMGGDLNPTNPAFRAADTRYRAWIEAVDAVALALLDDIDAYEALMPGGARVAGPISVPSEAGPRPTDVDGLFSGLDDLRRAIDLIGTVPSRPPASRRTGAVSRAMSVVGQDRAARHCSLGLDAGGRGAVPSAP